MCVCMFSNGSISTRSGRGNSKGIRAVVVCLCRLALAVVDQNSQWQQQEAMKQKQQYQLLRQCGLSCSGMGIVVLLLSLLLSPLLCRLAVILALSRLHLL